MLERRLHRLTWYAAIVFIPVETYICIVDGTFLRSEYFVNVTGAGILLWAAISLRKGKPYADGLLAAGWAWMTAVSWRATNLRYWFAADNETLMFGDIELWLGPVFTVVCAAALTGAVILLMRRDRRISQ